MNDKLILPILYRTCAIRADLKIIQVISFLAPKAYETAFQDILVALHLPVQTPVVPQKPTDTGHPHNVTTRLMQQIESAFTEHDWPDVIRKAEYLQMHYPESMTALAYRWQGVAFLEEGEEKQAQETFQTALALVSDRQERLTLLSDYTALLVRQQQWTKVLQHTKEALRLVPHDPSWQAIQQQAQNQLAEHASPTTLTPQPERPSEFYSQIGKKGGERGKIVAKEAKQKRNLPPSPQKQRSSG